MMRWLPSTSDATSSTASGTTPSGPTPNQVKHLIPDKPLDFVSPFSAGLGLAPPQGDSAWLHWGRNVNAAHFLPPEELFHGVEVLMVPKWGINNVPLIDLYGTHISRAFDPVRETEFWTVYRKRERQAG